MDEFLDYFLSSSSWSEGNVTERLSWVGNEPGQINELLPDSMGADKGDENNSHVSMIPSSHMIESLVTQGSSMLVGGASPQQKQEVIDCGSKPSLPRVVDINSKAGYMSLQLNTNSLTQGTLNHSSPELISMVGGSAKSPRAPPESGSVGSNDSEQSGFQPSLRDSHSLTSIPQLWHPPSYDGVSSFSSIMGQDKLQGFGLQGEYVDTNANVLGNRFLGDDKIPQMGNLPTSVSLDGQDVLNNHCLSAFATGQHIPLERTAGLHSQLQLPQSSEGNLIKHYTDQFPVSQLPHAPATANGGCNGVAKPRVRARRGQATDPHSIAERLRREKIAERMKNLQELVPNSNKTDKASMLDEIIEYVKFLQLQVKVLSMSRLGATGAVLPLITDSQAEGSKGLLLSPPAGQVADPFESQDNIAFEQEVVKLMESNVTTAMQFLQSKGLCLMPIALATAISGRKASSSVPVSADRKKLILTHGLVHQNNGPPGIGTCQLSSYGENVGEENVTRVPNGEHSQINGCNGTVVKQEEAKNTTCNSRELKPKA